METTTDLQTEKLDLIALLAKVDDRELVGEIAELVRRRGAGGEPEDGPPAPPLSEADLRARALASEADYAAGRVYDLEDVEREFAEPDEVAGGTSGPLR